MKTISSTLFVLVFLLQNLTAQQEARPLPKTFIEYNGDTIHYVSLAPVHIFTAQKFRSPKERMEYNRLVRDVRVAYPYAKMISSSIIETYEYMQSLPDEKTRQKHLEEVQKYLLDKYKPHMKKMTKNQGKILVKLIDRECNSSSYEIVKAIVGSFKAGVYNTFAGLFGNSLKARYEPDGVDRAIENIAIQIDEGSIDYYFSLGAR